MLGVPLNSLRMWDSGVRPTPGTILERVQVTVAEAIRDRRPLSLPVLATELNVHVRTLQAAARTGRLEVHYSTRSIFGRPQRLSTRAAGKTFLRTYYKRYGGQAAGRFDLPPAVPADCRRRLLELRCRLNLSQADVAELVGAANRAVVYQWESGRRVPSPIFWERIVRLCRWSSEGTPHQRGAGDTP
jgi:DNA-binding transcriptional regulator YiaG